MKNTKLLVLNAFIAALYVVLTVAVPGIAYGPIQARFSEILNHLYVFNKKLIFGILIGVGISNFLSFAIYDAFIGPFASFLAFLLSMFICSKLTNVTLKLIVNSVCSAIGMIVIAVEFAFLGFAPFWVSFPSFFLSELVMMLIGVVVFKVLLKNTNILKYIL